MGVSSDDLLISNMYNDKEKIRRNIIAGLKEQAIAVTKFLFL